MGEILGVGITHYPSLLGPPDLSSRGNLDQRADRPTRHWLIFDVVRMQGGAGE